MSELVQHGKKARHFRAWVEGAVLHKRTWTAGAEAKAKETEKAFRDEGAARKELDKALRGKMRDGYARLTPDAKPGHILHASFAGGGGGGAVLDLSLDGKQAVTASITPDREFGAKLHLIDVATGARRTVLDEPAGTRQCFLHTALFDAVGGALFFTLQDDTFRLDLESGARTHLAAGTPATFNPHVLRPRMDAARRRIVVCGEDARVRVLDTQTLATVHEVPTKAPMTECRAWDLSPSGKRLALWIVSRGLVYGHEDAQRDTTNEVHVWDLETGQRTHTLPFSTKLDQIALAPDDTTLTVSWSYAQGPVGIDLASGKELWRFEDGWRDDRLATAYCWTFSAAGAHLAVGRETPCLYDARTRAPVELEDAGGYRVGRTIFSGDGAVLAAHVAGTCVVYRVK